MTLRQRREGAVTVAWVIAVPQCDWLRVEYYSATILQMSGVRDDKLAIWLAAVTAFTNFLFTLVGVWLVERVGRRRLTMGSIIGTGLSLTLLATGFLLSAQHTPPVTLHPTDPTTPNSTCLAYGGLRARLRGLCPCGTVRRSSCLPASSRSCEQCMLDPDCGFCYRENGTSVTASSCLPVNLASTGEAAWGRGYVRKGEDEGSGMGGGGWRWFWGGGEGEGGGRERGGGGGGGGVSAAFGLSLASSFPLCSNSSQMAEGTFWAYNYCPTSYSWIVLLGLILYLASFAPGKRSRQQGMGPMPWTVNSEIYPLWARSTGNACSAGVNWIFNVLVSLTFLHVAQYLTYYGAFFMYSGLAALGFLFIYGCLPETKGRRLEEIESLFESRLCTCGASDSDEGRQIEYIRVKGSNYHLSDNDASDVDRKAFWDS
ncbi:hypothetical protein JZ751_003553 [Albula glossodonta]|uniref:Major facilitator superfamily (MFS) profile domain-containing protein n=1 Tax=Albula glossodonta TaxID=121402 RepID=A0A8T2N7I1_9TELE|nr:hypothetical protein JZ751_003553 [Albula glossodonta]